ncbi:MAG: magnesium chelatase ATPase subunit D, partial [Pseudomonadota bacterium]
MNARARKKPTLPASDAALVGLLFALNPHAFGGVRLCGLPGPARTRWLKRVRALRGEDSAWLKVPVSVSDERLLGGLDFAATIGSGKPVFATGLLEAADGGVIVLAMAERVAESAAAVIASVLDSGEVRAERDGLQRTAPGRF